MKIDEVVFRTFGVIVADTVDEFIVYTNEGVVTDFVATPIQLEVIGNQRATNSLLRRGEVGLDAFEKQIKHYINEYGVFDEDVFDISFDHTDMKIPVRVVMARSVDGIADMVRKKIYANSPIKDVDDVLCIIKHYSIDFEFDLVKNNEVRAALWDGQRASAEEVMRALVYRATGETMLVKSKEVLEALKYGAYMLSPSLLEKQSFNDLGASFNRLKPYWLAIKAGNRRFASLVNRISRKSKTKHKPLVQSPAKTLISDWQKGVDVSFDDLSVRDLMKIIVACSSRRVNTTGNEVFVVRNGKVFTRMDYTMSAAGLVELESMLLNTLAERLRGRLQGRKVLLDRMVDYGLPVSAKQTMGRLPYGTRIKSGDQMSIGIFWREGDGASDLDLSAVDEKGNRTGWGGVYGGLDYGVVFSGDMVRATPHATEFFTTSEPRTFGIFVNNYSGDNGAKFDLMIGDALPQKRFTYGSDIDAAWMEVLRVRERTSMDSRGMILGFLEDNVFTVFKGRLNDRVANFNQNTDVIKRGRLLGEYTVSKLLELAGVDIVLSAQELGDDDYDLSYDKFTYEKLEDLFGL